jgi:hypothetical protein
LEAEAEADATRALGDARAAADAAQLGAFDGLAAETQLALTLRELAGNLPAIEHLTVTPDLLTQALVQLVGNLGAAAPAPTAGGAR